ncbi:hypothetical protein DL93DRAFT_574380 [Clavulina sp. PMI_390]|nr:hypothetical protein DL93DRAFT_574380 [Clavulina sp. PMI_390]
MTFTHDSPRDEATDPSKEGDELREIWKEGLSAFRSSSKQSLDDMPFYEKLREDVSIEGIEEALEGCGIALKNFRKKGQTIRNALKPLLGLLKAIIDPIGELVATFGIPGGKAIFVAVARLLQAVDGVTQKYNDLTLVLLSLHQILGRLEILLHAKAVTHSLRKLYVQTLTQVLVIMGLYINYCDTTRRSSSWRNKTKAVFVRLGK